jgi:hypothetical protein
MSELSEALFASLLMQRRDRQGRRSTIFAPIGYDTDDLRAARERTRKR